MTSPSSKRRSSSDSEKPPVVVESSTLSPLAALAATPEYLISAIYPGTLLLAGTFYLLSPSAANSSYFSQKHNIFNVVFVKYGWLWTTLVFLVHLSRVRASRSKALLRWGIATVWWILITQWCFGPPIMDRAFLVTGGACKTLNDDLANSRTGMTTPVRIMTGATCKIQGGKWSGGHDLSGHVFLLTHASLFLWSELLPFLKAGLWGGFENSAVYFILGMWWWMLLMTGIYFHTWIEKVPPSSRRYLQQLLTKSQATGLIVALVQWAAVYLWALKTQPQARKTLGVPGI